MVTVRNQDREFEMPEPGSYPAVCYKVVDLGTQESEFQGKKLRRRQVVIGWELAEKMESGEHFIVSGFYTASLGEKAKLRAMLESWRGSPFTKDELEGFNIGVLLGKTCIVSLIKNEKDKIKVSAVGKMMKGVAPHVLVNKIVHLDLEKFDQAVFDGLSDKMKDIIRRSPEYHALLNPKAIDEVEPEGAIVEDVPF